MIPLDFLVWLFYYMLSHGISREAAGWIVYQLHTLH